MKVERTATADELLGSRPFPLSYVAALSRGAIIEHHRRLAGLDSLEPLAADLLAKREGSHVQG